MPYDSFYDENSKDKTFNLVKYYPSTFLGINIANKISCCQMTPWGLNPEHHNIIYSILESCAQGLAILQDN